MQNRAPRRKRRRTKNPTLPELEQVKNAVLASLGSRQSQRAYGHAIEEFIQWYCSEPRLALSRSVVMRYRLELERRGLAPSTINVRLAAVRRLATEASDSGLLSPDLLAGIRRVRGVKQLGKRLGNWLSVEQSRRLLGRVDTRTLRGKRDAAMLGLLLGCGLRRSELVELDVNQVRLLQDRWVIFNLVGKGGRVRTVPVPKWVKQGVDEWICAAEITEGRLFRGVRKDGTVWGHGLSQGVVCYVVKQCARRAGAPSSLRTTCAEAAPACATSPGGELEQIQFLLGHATVLTTERYLGCKQRISEAVNDRIEIADCAPGLLLPPRYSRPRTAGTPSETSFQLAKPASRCAVADAFEVALAGPG